MLFRETRLGEVFRLGWTRADRFSRLQLLSALLLVIGGSTLTGLAPVALKWTVDGLSAPQPDNRILYFIAAFVLCNWLARACGDFRFYIYSRAEQRVLCSLTEQVFVHLLRLPLRFHLNRRTGAITSILDNGMAGYQTVHRGVLFSVMPVLVEVTTVGVVLTRLPSGGTFLALCGGALVCYAAAFARAIPRVAPASAAATNANIETSAAVTDGILNYETIKYFGAEAVVQRKVNRALARTEAAWATFQRTYAVNALGISTLFAVFLGSTVWFAIREVQQGRMTVGGVVLVCAYMLQTVRPMETLGFAMLNISEGLAKIERMLALLKEAGEPQSKQAGEPRSKQPGVLPAARPLSLEFENVSLSYGPGPPTLRNVSFRVPAGKTIGIVGPSGSGKSSIVRLLVRLLEPDTGRILLDNRPISELSLAQLRSQIAVVPQETMLFNDTIGYNILFGDPSRTCEDVERAARLAHIHDLIMRLPAKYETPVGERGAKLSVGERQRVSIARAAMKNPRIYVFDEATSSLDSESEREIMRNIRQIAHGCTTFVIAHRLSTIVHADEIIVVESGRVVEQGTHEALLDKNGRYAAFWRAQQGGAGESRLRELS